MRATAVLMTCSLVLVACGRSDRDLDKRVKAHLAAEAPAEQVSINTSDHIVTLDGLVASEAQRSRLERAARAVPGVLAVDNRLGLQADVSLTGADLKDQGRMREEVRRQLEKAGLDDLEIELRDQTVVLRGYVTPAQHDAAMVAASRALPDLRIEDRLTVGE